MNICYRTMKVFAIVILSLYFCGSHVLAATPEPAIKSLLPADGFSEGWTMEGKAEVFTEETLYTHINGEAELYMPYGFQDLGFALYVKAADAKTALAVDVYRMKSLLDAFGIYSNYRSPDDSKIKIGADGFVADSQLMFYQDRYFVRLSASGTDTLAQNVFIACAEAIAKRLPSPPVKPLELELLKVPGIIPGTEKYVAESLLGYKFFKKGLVAQASLDGATIKVFVVITESTEGARNTFDQYAGYLKQAGIIPKVEVHKERRTLIAQDPLYKGVVIRQSGPYLLGVSNIQDTLKGILFLDGWRIP
ncbi:MAG: hypothetical protein C0392_11240 [Syntrophus sp. (in: bacteria)]|nr:hypothetical protein [Syntrophus sp. (in: bacteria)]